MCAPTASAPNEPLNLSGAMRIRIALKITGLPVPVQALTPSGVVARERAVRVGSLFQGSKSERTFTTALLLLGAVAVLQFSGAAIYYFRRARVEVSAPTMSGNSGTVAVATSVLPGTSAAPVAVAKNTLAPAPKAPARSGRVAVPGDSVPNELLQVAKALRLHGDTGNAIAKLQQAIALDPRYVNDFFRVLDPEKNFTFEIKDSDSAAPEQMVRWACPESPGSQRSVS